MDLTPTGPDPQLITNIVFGIFMAILALITIYQGARIFANIGRTPEQSMSLMACAWLFYPLILYIDSGPHSTSLSSIVPTQGTHNEDYLPPYTPSSPIGDTLQQQDTSNVNGVLTSSTRTSTSSIPKSTTEPTRPLPAAFV